MNKQFQSFKGEMDGWVKSFNGQLTNLGNFNSIVTDNSENIDHNYELIQEMRSEMRRLKEEISALRMVQLLHLKTDVESIKTHK